MLKSLQFFLLIFCKSGKIVIISPYTAFIIKATKVNNHFKKEGANMMTTLTRYMKKTTAIAMAAMVLSLPLASVASAHGRHTPPPPPRHSDSYYKHHHYDKYHKNDNYVTKKDSNKKATTSFIIGAVLGAVIAKNT